MTSIMKTLRRQPFGWLLAASLALVLSSNHRTAYLYLLGVNSFAPKVFVCSRTRNRSHASSSSSTSDSSESENQQSNGNNEAQQRRTLYDILGASPNDSQQQLKMKYIELARQKHPDAAIGRTIAEDDDDGDNTNVDEFHEIASAWSILADPKERLRYDRSLKAKELTDSIEQLVETGIRHVAVPFFRKTANTTIAAVETSSKTMQDVSQRVERARDLFELEKKTRDLEQQAAKETARSTTMKTQLDTLFSDKRRHKTLSSTSPSSSKLTSIEARRLLDSFYALDKKVSSLSNSNSTTQSPPSTTSSIQAETNSAVVANKHIQALEKVELEYKKKIREQQAMEKAVRDVERKAENAVKAEKLALQRLEDAKRAVDQARRSVEQANQATKDAKSREKQAGTEMEKVSVSLERQTQQVRDALRRKEEESLQGEAVYLKQQSARSEDLAKTLKSKAEELKKQSEELRRKEGSGRE